MRTMLLSFKADVYKKVLTGDKLYEHQKVFTDEPIKAYLYVISPIKSIVGVMYLNNKTSIESWKEKYSYDEKKLGRISDYLKYHKFSMEIISFQNTNKISLLQLRTDIEKFVVPPMHYFIDDNPLLDYFKQKLIPCGTNITHDFSIIKSEQICKE